MVRLDVKGSIKLRLAMMIGYLLRVESGFRERKIRL
jgi:hypothetical protein